MFSGYMKEVAYVGRIDARYQCEKQRLAQDNPILQIRAFSIWYFKVCDSQYKFI